MPVPGKSGNQRTIVRTTINGQLYQRLGACALNPIVGPPGGLAVQFIIDPVTLSPLLADDDGVMPELLADPNVTITTTPDDSAQRLTGWGPVVNGGQSGQTRGTYARLVLIGNTQAYTLELFALMRLTDGTCEYVLIFGSGGISFSTLTAGDPATLPNRAYCGGAINGALATASGTAAIAIPS